MMAETRGFGLHALGTWGFPLFLWLGVSRMHFFDFILVELLGSAFPGLFVFCLFSHFSTLIHFCWGLGWPMFCPGGSGVLSQGAGFWCVVFGVIGDIGVMLH